MKKLGFIGLGNMGRAIASGLITGGAIAGNDVYGYAPTWDKLCAYAQETGIHACKSALEVVGNSDTILIAVKPYVIEGVLAEIKDALKGKALISVALGYDYARLSSLLDDSTRIQFIMPNTPAMVGSGVMLFEKTNSLEAEEHEQLLKLFATLGLVEELPSHLMGIGGAVSGCGPAFCALVIEALADAGVKYGLPRATAYRLASKTLSGTGDMQLKTGSHPGVIKDGVCSPGGTTIRGVEALERAGLRAAMLDAVQAVMEKKA
ncbi:MAG: pyrroline-5-carboxylate reductase [Clostridia bacterium]|nr:pyrroline-5-carboxylate reductase [Clostridia bacterium]